MKYLLLLKCSLLPLLALGQADSDSLKAPSIRGSYVYYVDGVKQFPKGTRLDSVFSLESISGILIKTSNSSYQLDRKQCKQLISILAKAVKANGLQVKPTGKTIEFIFKRKRVSLTTSYFSPGQIHFDSGIDRWGQKFYGTFILPDHFDIDTLVKVNQINKLPPLAHACRMCLSHA